MSISSDSTRAIAYCTNVSCPKYLHRIFDWNQGRPLCSFICDGCACQGAQKPYRWWVDGPENQPISGVWVYFSWDSAIERYRGCARVELKHEGSPLCSTFKTYPAGHEPPSRPPGRVYHLEHPFVSIESGALRCAEGLLANLLSGHMLETESPSLDPGVIDWDLPLAEVVKQTQAAIVTMD